MSEELAALKAEREGIITQLRQRIIDLETALTYSVDTTEELERQRDEAVYTAEQWKINAEICYETCDELRQRIAVLEALTTMALVDGGS